VFVARLISNLTIMGFVAVLLVFLVMRRPPKARAAGIYGRFVAVSGSFLGLGIVQLPPQELSPAVYLTSTLLVLGGTVFATYAVLGLGRSLSVLPEARGLVTRGPYAMIRHPLYLGELVALLGVTVQYFSGWALLLLLLQCAFQVERMRNEERVLSRVFPEYRDYMARTARLVPHIY
jgi:protein-S-isoprenylcysteine O-methyltransferase Ste14